MIIDGKKIAEEIVGSIGNALEGATLGLVVGQADAATESFIKIKSRLAERLGVRVVRGSFEEVKDCDGIIVQLPIENTDALLAQLPPQKDVDGIGTMGVPIVLPPVVGAMKEILERAGVSVAGARVAVVGEGKLVGAPAAAWFATQGAQVEHVRLPEDAPFPHDIVVLGAGKPGILKPEMIKKGAVVLDAGTSEASGKLAGDATPGVAEVASVFTPVPGGIGPIAVAMIFKNLLELKNRG